MMNVTAKSGKAATRGQKQIYEENQAVILYYSIAAISSSLVFSICSALQIAAILTMRSMAHCRRNEKGQVTDAGSDLNQPDAFGEYCKDVVILCSFVATVASFWSGILWLLLLIPVYVVYKLWKLIIAPWFFTESLEQEEDEKKIKKREKRLRKT
uniref:Transmembrane protein 208 n=1 Tax=Setaria digitata TaxID=48799 RepID=A0A915Q1X9_9BILA